MFQLAYSFLLGDSQCAETFNWLWNPVRFALLFKCGFEVCQAALQIRHFPLFDLDCVHQVRPLGGAAANRAGRGPRPIPLVLKMRGVVIIPGDNLLALGLQGTLNIRLGSSIANVAHCKGLIQVIVLNLPTSLSVPCPFEFALEGVGDASSRLIGSRSVVTFDQDHPGEHRGDRVAIGRRYAGWTWIML